MKKTFLIKHLPIRSNTRVLVSLPHPDDETVFTAGLIQKALKASAHVKLNILTKGELSTKRYGLSPGESLLKAREKEIVRTAKILGVQDTIIGDFADGCLGSKPESVTRYLQNLITEHKPDVVITLEPDGAYGHPDHIALSRVITRMYDKDPRQFQLLYATVDDRFLKNISSGTISMAKQEIHPLAPEIQLRLTIDEIARKLQAFRSHYTQFGKTTLPFLMKWYKRGLLHNEFFILKKEHP